MIGITSYGAYIHTPEIGQNGYLSVPGLVCSGADQCGQGERSCAITMRTV
jgi:hypothetical protein